MSAATLFCYEKQHFIIFIMCSAVTKSLIHGNILPRLLSVDQKSTKMRPRFGVCKRSSTFIISSAFISKWKLTSSKSNLNMLLVWFAPRPIAKCLFATPSPVFSWISRNVLIFTNVDCTPGMWMTAGICCCAIIVSIQGKKNISLC